MEPKFYFVWTLHIPLFCLLWISHTYLSWQLCQLDLEDFGQERYWLILVEVSEPRYISALYLI